MIRNLLRRRHPATAVVSPAIPAPNPEPPAHVTLSARGSHTISPPKVATHTGGMPFLSARYNHSGMRVLEIGSRVVTGANYRSAFDKAEYVGFDYYDGPNVDIVGDAHKLSRYFDEGEKFDLIYSLAVFEHLYMPWLAAQEIAKMLKLGGMVFVETHFSFAAHERPWNFFQFSEMGLRALFNKGLGFDLVDMGMSNPIVGFFSDDADEYLRRRPVHELYCHSEILCRKERDASDFDWARVDVDDVVDGGRYPQAGA